MRGKNKRTMNRVKPVQVSVPTCSPACMSASPLSVSSPPALVPHPSSVPLRMSGWLTVCLSLATRRLKERSIDLCSEVVGVLWGRGAGGGGGGGKVLCVIIPSKLCQQVLFSHSRV